MRHVRAVPVTVWFALSFTPLLAHAQARAPQRAAPAACKTTLQLEADVREVTGYYRGGGGGGWFTDLLRCDRPAARALAVRWLHDPDMDRRYAALPAIISLGRSAGVSCDSLRSLVADSIDFNHPFSSNRAGDVYASRAVLAAGAVGCTGDQQLDLMVASVGARDNRSELVANRFPANVIAQLKSVTLLHVREVLPRLIGSTVPSEPSFERKIPFHDVLVFAPLLLRETVAGDSALGVFIGRWLFDPSAPTARVASITDSTKYDTFVRVVRAYRATAAPWALARLRAPALPFARAFRPPVAQMEPAEPGRDLTEWRRDEAARLRQTDRELTAAITERAYAWAAADGQLALVSAHMRKVIEACGAFDSKADKDQSTLDARAYSQPVYLLLDYILKDGWSDPTLSAYLRELVARPISNYCGGDHYVRNARSRER